MRDKPYFYIEAWGRLTGSHLEYIKRRIDKAREENAPDTAIYKHGDVWRVVADVTSSERREILTNMVTTMEIRRR